MRWLPILSKRTDLRSAVQSELSPSLIEERQLVAAEKHAQALEKLADFVTGQGLVKTLSALAQSGAAASLLQGLTTHAGRNGLDARTQTQNAREIYTLVRAVFHEFQANAEAIARGEQRDAELKDAEAEFRQWQEKNQ